MSVAWLPGWWGIAVCVAWGIAIGVVGTLIYTDRRVWVQNEQGRHRGGQEDESKGRSSGSERDLL